MYKCETCGEYFKTPNEEKVRYDAYTYGAGAVDTEYICPSCGSEDYYECECCQKCKCGCEETIGGLCEDCYSDLAQRFTQLLKKHFTEEEIVILAENYDYWEHEKPTGKCINCTHSEDVDGVERYCHSKYAFVSANENCTDYKEAKPIAKLEG